MRRSRFAQAGFIVLFVAGCSSTGTPPPTAASPNASAGPSADLGSPTPATTPSPSPTPSASPTPLTTANGWQQVPGQVALTTMQATVAVWTGQRFLAAGMLDDGSTGILDSTDGQTWHSQAGFGPGSRVFKISAGPAGVLAVGAQDADARSWFSTDGLTWKAAPDSAALRPGKDNSIQMEGATSTPTGWLAVGQEEVSCVVDCGSWAAVRADVWSSVDGLHWTREPVTSALANAGMTGVVRGGPGYVAVGGASNGAAQVDGLSHAVVWTSTDGRAWLRIKDAPIFHATAGIDPRLDVSASSIATDGSHLVAVGEGASQDLTAAIAWWSDDGRTWQRGTGERFQYGQLWQVASVPGGFLGAGPSGPDSCLGGIWSSTDGRAWSCIAADPPFDSSVATDAAASPTLELVVGYNPDGGASIFWTRPVP
jgi:hypothetical protein